MNSLQGKKTLYIEYILIHNYTIINRVDSVWAESANRIQLGIFVVVSKLLHCKGIQW